MKKLLFCLFTLLVAITGRAQTIGEAFYIYRNDGQFNAFLREEVDSITYSYYDEDSLYYNEIVTQIVYTADSIYMIPLASIDSISFVTPETKYTPQVVKMEPLLPYITGVDGMKLSFSSDMPSNLFPKTDDVLVLDNFDHEQFPVGFAGKMSARDGQQIICDSVSFEEIYEHILCYGYYTAENDSNSSDNSKARFVARSRAEGNISRSILINGSLGSKNTGLYASVNGRVGLDLRFTFKYNAGEPVYFDISMTPKLSLSLEAGIKGSYKPEPLKSNVPLLLIPIPSTPFYFKLTGGPIMEMSVNASIVAKTEAKIGYKFGVKYENGSFKWNGGNTSKWFSTPDVTGSINGSVFVGLNQELGIFSYGDIVSLVVEKKVGPELEASISENILSPNDYQELRDAYLDVNLMASADFKAEAKFFKFLKLSAKYNILSGRVNFLKYRLVPSFTKPSVSIEKSSAIVSVIPKDDLLFPVSIGLGLWDYNNSIIDAQFCEGTYRNSGSWPINEYRTLFSDLVPNTDYTVRPMVNFFGGTIIAPPEEIFKIPVIPITLDVYDIQDSSAIAFGRIEGYDALGENIECGIGYTSELTGRAFFPATNYNGGGEFYTHLIALRPNTTYNYFAYVVVDGETLCGEEKTFTTKNDDDDDAEAYYVDDRYTRTFYYDNKRAERHGKECGNKIQVDGETRKVIFDTSFSKLHPTSFTFCHCKLLTSIENIHNLNTTYITNMSEMFSGCSSLTSLDLSRFDTSNVTDMSNMFYGCDLTSLDLSRFDTSKVTDMSEMFYGCSSLTSLDLSSFDTSKVTDMSDMFFGCSSLTSLDLSRFDTSKVTNMRMMFSWCSSLTSLDLSGANTSNVTNMFNMFGECSSLTSLDLSSFDTSNVTDMSSMFSGCSSLRILDISNFDFSNVTSDDTLMFPGCSSLKILYCTNMRLRNTNHGMFRGLSTVETIDLSNANTSNMTNMEMMFLRCSSLTNLDLSSFDTSNVTDMSSMFSGCSSLTSLDMSNCDASNVTRRSGMFNSCSSLRSLDLSGFIFPEDVSFLFSELSSLTNLILSGANTSNVTNMFRMFGECSSLTSLDLSSFDTSKVTNMRVMFSGCSSLTSLDLSSFDTSKVTDMSWMFYECSSLISLDLSSFDTSNVTNMSEMFESCLSLTSLDLSSFDTSNVAWMECMFYNCLSLTTIYAGNWNYLSNNGIMFGCENLIGGKGTKIGGNLYGYDELGNSLYYYCPSDSRAAHIDGGKDWPGLFTAK